MVSSAEMATIAPARGVRVHIPDASPQVCGYVMAMRPTLDRDSRQRFT